MVENESDLLRRHVKCLVLETHENERGIGLMAKTLATLEDLGFQIQERQGDVLAMMNCQLC